MTSPIDLYEFKYNKIWKLLHDWIRWLLFLVAFNKSLVLWNYRLVLLLITHQIKWLMVFTLLMLTLILLIEPSRAKYIGRLLLFPNSPQLLFVILTSFLKYWITLLSLQIWSAVPDFKVSPHLTPLAISFVFIFQMLISLNICSQAHKMLSFQGAICSTICNVSDVVV